MSYSNLRIFPTDEEKKTTLIDTTEFSGEERVTEDASLLIQYTAENVCTTCGFADMCANNGNGALYVRCQNPNSLVSTRPHHALQGCEGRGYEAL